MSDVKKTTEVSKGRKQAQDVSALFRARNPLVWIVTREEARVEALLIEAAAAAKYVPHFWDVAQGFTSADGKPEDTSMIDPTAAMTAIRTKADDKYKAERGVWIMRDLPIWLNGQGGAAPLRQLRNLARYLPGVKRDNSQAIIVITTDPKVPDELAGHAIVIEWAMPDRAEIAAILDAALNSLPAEIKANAVTPTTREQAIDAAIGLTGEEAASCYARSLVQTRRIDPSIVMTEKKRVISRERVLEWFEPVAGGMDAVGGLDNLKLWIDRRKSAYSPEARAYGLPAPKGAVLVGVPGCGKSLLAKCLATGWGVPLIRLDLGALKSKFVGDSEGNLRKALKVIEALGRCVVWIDEIEKALQGATSGSADGGVSSDALGTILAWMQERTCEAFVIATANDVEALPPELLRKGRFDEVFFVDTPNGDERVSVLKATLKTFKRETGDLDLRAIADACDDFTGSEIASLIPEALFEAFNDGARPLETNDLLKAASTVVPLTSTAKEKIEKLREWAKSKARPATLKPEHVEYSAGRKLDLEEAA